MQGYMSDLNLDTLIKLTTQQIIGDPEGGGKGGGRVSNQMDIEIKIQANCNITKHITNIERRTYQDYTIQLRHSDGITN